MSPRTLFILSTLCAALVPACATQKPATPVAASPATRPAVPPITDIPAAKSTAPGGWLSHHNNLVALAKKGNIDLYFAGDSITDFWTTRGRTVWDKEFLGWKPGDFGISGDQTQHVLWRLQNGELDGVSPKVIVLMIGTNNTALNTSEEIARGVTAIVNVLKQKEPQAKILLLAIFPRGATPSDPKRILNENANKIIASLDDGKQVKYMNINAQFLAPDGTLSRDLFPDLLHPNAKGYQLWADAIRPQLTAWLGPQPATQPAQ